MLDHGSDYTLKKVRRIPTVRGADIMRDPKITKVCQSIFSTVGAFLVLLASEWLMGKYHVTH